MEAFSLLKYWKAGGGGGRGLVGDTRATAVSTITTTAESDSDGPFFDLEFTIPSSCSSSSSDEEEEEEEEEEEIKAEAEGREKDATESSSSEVILEGRLVVPVEPEPNSKAEDTPTPTPIPIPSPSSSQFSLLKSATKFRVLLLGRLKKGSAKGEEGEKQQKWGTRKLLTVVKLKVEEVPLFSSSSSRSKSQQEAEEEEEEQNKRFLKYINKVKPLYVKVSKMRFVKGGGEVGKVVGPERRRREDDSLLEQQDGIQGAILHCKRSFNASSSSSTSADSEVTLLPRSVSDPSHEKFTELFCRNASDSEAIGVRKVSSGL